MDQTTKSEFDARGGSSHVLAAASLRGGDVFDLECSLENVGGSVDVLHDLIEIFFEISPSMLAGLRHAIDARDVIAVERAAHAMRGSISVFGAARLSNLVITLEDAARHGGLHDFEPFYEEIEWETARLRRAFEHFREDMRHARPGG